MATDCLIGLGANVGDRSDSLSRARDELQRISSGRFRASAVCESLPSGGQAGQTNFLNAVVRMDWEGTAAALFARTSEIEDRLGRIRGSRWGPRVIDLDLLLCGREVLTTPELIVPHPRLAVRRFVLAPASRIAADMEHPLYAATIGELWRRLNQAPRRVALLGPPSRATSDFRERLSTAAPHWHVEDRSSDELAQFQPPPRLIIALGDGDKRLDAPLEGAQAALHPLCPILNLNFEHSSAALEEAVAALAALQDDAILGWIS